MIQFPSELPACCVAERLRLPRPHEAVIDVHGAFGRSQAWFAGLDEWVVRIGVRWSEFDDSFAAAVDRHCGLTEDALAAHGVALDEDGYAWVGEQIVQVARLRASPVGGRRVIEDGYDLWEAADELAGDLESLVAPIVADRQDDDDLMSKAVVETWPDAAITNAVILLQSVRVTPVMRGHLLGAWAAAQAVELFDHGCALVATKGAPLTQQDAVPDLDPKQIGLTSEQSDLWQAEQERLCRHWHKHLGLIAAPGTPSVLTWHTSYRNEAIERTLALWA